MKHQARSTNRRHQARSTSRRHLAAKITAAILALTMSAMSIQAAETNPVQGMGTVQEKDVVQEMVAKMTLDEKISQMIIPAIRQWDGKDVTELAAADGLSEALQKHQYGGIILFGSNVKGTEQTARLVSDLQKNNAQISTDAHIPYFMPLDEEGGIVTRLGMGTRMTGNMAIGATWENAAANARSTGSLIGEELAALGFNVDFAPDIDVNSNAANPVIGTRSFSDDPATVAELGTTFVQGLSTSNIIGTYKHFPGHGDTDTDSHTGTPSVNKTLEQLGDTEFVPFRAAIDQGADMIMTAHITLPLADDEVTFANGTKGYYPATMSKKIMTDVLRGDLGFDGVIVTDALEMDAIAKAKLVEGEERSIEYHVNIAEKVINAGVDILLLPLDLTSTAAADFYDGYIGGLASRINNGQIDLGRINESVTRILKLKAKYGILDMDTSGEDLDTVVANAKKIVGSDEHHLTEMAMAKQAITMLKNEGQTLPFNVKQTLQPDEDQAQSINEGQTQPINEGQTQPISQETISEETGNIVLVGRNKGDTVALTYAVGYLQREGLLAEDAFVRNLANGTEEGSPDSGISITIDYYFDSSSKPVRYSEELQQAVAAADRVAAVSVSWGLSDISPNAVQYKAISGLIADTQANGGKFVLISSNLPYDSARYQDADAILLTYMSSGTGVDPTDRAAGDNAGAYNANILAALAILFGGGSPSGRLPVNIPEIVEDEEGKLRYSDSILYERGFGLEYDEPQPVDLSSAEVTGLQNVTYTGKAITQPFTVTLGGQILDEAKDYDTVYRNNKNAGLAFVTITGKGAYTGTITKTFIIKRAENTILVAPKERVFRRALLFFGRIFSIQTAESKGIVTYTLFHSTKNAGIRVTRDGRVLIPGSCPKGTYRILVRASGNRNYEGKSEVVKIVVR